MEVLMILDRALAYLELGVFWAVALAGVVGAVQAAATREDAYPAADRQGRWVWTGLLVLSAFSVALRLPLLNWIGMVIIGVYWFDVRPQLRSLIDGAAGR